MLICKKMFCKAFLLAKEQTKSLKFVKKRPVLKGPQLECISKQIRTFCVAWEHCKVYYVEHRAGLTESKKTGRACAIRPSVA